MAGIEGYLNRASFGEQLTEIETVLQNAEAKISRIWGHKIVTVEGFEGSTSSSYLEERVLQAVGSRLANGNLSTRERLTGCRIITKLRRGCRVKEDNSFIGGVCHESRKLIGSLICALAGIIHVIVVIALLVLPNFIINRIADFLDRYITFNPHGWLEREATIDRYDREFRIYKKSEFLETFGGTLEDLENWHHEDHAEFQIPSPGFGLPYQRFEEENVLAKRDSIEALLDRV